MRRAHRGALVGAVSLALLGTSAVLPAVAGDEPEQPDVATVEQATGPAEEEATLQRDDLPSEQSDQQRELRRDAVTQLVKGEARIESVRGKKVLRVRGRRGCPDRFVQYDVNRRASVFTILVEFGDLVSPTTGGTPGPLHNQIPQPDRQWDGGTTDDNSTSWVADFDRAHYLDLMFGATNSFRDYYRKQSQGRFATAGDVSDWVRVPFNEARYGANKVKGAVGYWPFVRDTGNAWFAAQKAAGRTDEQIKDYLKQFDVWDRYDFDADGNFEEPDGYIDHFQAIHAGAGEEAGGGAQGEDAIWSHRWYAFSFDKGKTGPEQNKNGGTQIGTSGYWIGDYTTEPENGGLGVFVHEFGHDLGLPDLYDTTNKASNGTAFWTLMSSGSWLNDGATDLGTSPGNFGAWEKQQLGWLDVATTTVGRRSVHTLSAASVDTTRTRQAVAVALPDQQVTGQLNRPFLGNEWWSGTSSNRDATLTIPIDLTQATTSATVSAYRQYDTEPDRDLFTAEVSTDAGATWTVLGAPLSGRATLWSKLEKDLSAYLGKSILFRWRYTSDGAVNKLGVFLDSLYVIVDGRYVNYDGADSDTGWVAQGFTRIDGTGTRPVGHYYLVENRQYVDYDANLRTGPYNFGWLPDPAVEGDKGRPDWVERFPYQNGMLVWYVDDAYQDNNVSDHVGHGHVLPVDAHPAPLTWADSGQAMAPRIQMFDAAFSWKRTPAFTLHRFGKPTDVKDRPGMPVFYDTAVDAYYRDGDGIKFSSTKTAGSGARVAILGQEGTNLEIQVTYVPVG